MVIAISTLLMGYVSSVKLRRYKDDSCFLADAFKL